MRAFSVWKDISFAKPAWPLTRQRMTKIHHCVVPSAIAVRPFDFAE